LQKKSTVSSQCQIIASIFENNIYRPLSKRDIEKEFGLRCCLQHITFPKQFDSIEDIISQCLPLPGDVQRALRNFYTKYEKYGLGQIQQMGFDSIKLDDDWVIFKNKNIKILNVEKIK
jgi:hypothetical protein